MEKLKSAFLKSTNFIDVLVLLAMLGLTMWAWPQIAADARVPIHWGIDGQVDGWADKSLALFCIPGISIFVDFVSRIALSTIDDAKAEHKSKTLAVACISATMIFLGMVHGLIVFTALGHNLPVGQVIPAAIGVLFLILGLVMALGKSERNPFFGVRTPWSMQSDEVWNKTNRWSGWMMVGMGAATLATAIINNMILMAGTILAGTLLLVVGSYFYSYRAHKEELARGK